MYMHASASQSICLSVCQSVSQSVSLSVCQPVFTCMCECDCIQSCTCMLLPVGQDIYCDSTIVLGQGTLDYFFFSPSSNINDYCQRFVRHCNFMDSQVGS